MERRLRLSATVLAIVLASNCNRHDPQAAERSWRQIESDLRHDRLTAVAERARRNAIAWSDRPASDPYIRFRLLEAEALLARGNGETAFSMLSPLQPSTAALKIRRELDLTDAYIRLGNYKDAEFVLERELQNPELSHLDELRINAFNLKGQLLGKMGRNVDSEAAYHVALAKADARHDLYWRARILNNLGMSHMSEERYDEAIPYFEQALAAIEGQDALRLKSVFLGNLEICYNELGDLDRALNMRMQALAIQEKLPPSKSTMNSYGELGRLYDEMNDPRKAVEYYRRALDVAANLHVKAEAATWAVDLALAQIELQDWMGASRANDQARQLDPSGSDDLGLYLDLNTAAISAGRGQIAEAEKKYLEVATAPSSNAWPKWAAYDELGKLYARAGKRSESNRCFENAIALIASTRAELSRVDEKITFLTQPIRIYQDYVDALVDQHEDLKAMLVADSNRAQVMLAGSAEGATIPVDVPALQRLAASAHAVLLSYWFAPRQSFVWVVSAHEARAVRLAESETRIRELVNAYRDELIHSLRDPLTNASSAGWRLSDALIKPIQDFVPAGSNVIVIPDGPLHNLNLETLPVSRDKHEYWIEQVTLSIAPSLAGLLAKENAREPRGRGLLIVGDPEPVAQYTRLGNAALEIAALQKRFPGRAKTVLTGPDANSDRYREERPERFALIHFAAHAEANAETPLDSSVILSSGIEGYKLYARDIVAAKSPLRADLVTISSCTSAGLKSYHGEGLVGFAWAFLHAGARNVVAGLWDADDDVTAQLMDRMYAHLEAGQTPVESLRSAKLELMHSTRGPYYWGPFQVYRRRG